MKKKYIIIIVLATISALTYFGYKIFSYNTSYNNILPPKTTNQINRNSIMPIINSDTFSKITPLPDFNNSDLLKTIQKYNYIYHIYHSKMYVVLIKDGKIKALYDGNETNQTKLLKKFKHVYIPNKLFLEPFKKALYSTNDKKLNSFIEKHKNAKNNILQVAYLYNQFHNIFNDGTSAQIDENLYSSTENKVLENNNSMIMLNNGFYYLKITHIQRNKNDTKVYPEYFHIEYEGNGFYCNKDAGASSSIMINGTFPQLTNYDLKFADEFNQKVLIKFAMNTSYYINYGISFFNTNLLSIDMIYNEMGCGGTNTYGYFKTFNIDLKHAKYLKITDFFYKTYINNYILNTLYQILVKKYEYDMDKNYLKSFLNSFTIDKNFIYFYFDQGSVTSNTYGYFVIKIPYDTNKLKFKFF